MLNEIYSKNIGLKNYTSSEGLINDWKIIEDEFLSLRNNKYKPDLSFSVSVSVSLESEEKKYKILHKFKQNRLYDNMKKLEKHLKNFDEVRFICNNMLFLAKQKYANRTK